MKCGGQCGVWCVVCCMTVIFPRTRGERREAGAGGTNHRQRRETDRAVERGERRQGDSQSVSEGERWSTFTCTRSQSLTPRPRRDWTLRWTSCWRATTGPLLLLPTSTLRILTIFTHLITLVKVPVKQFNFTKITGDFYDFQSTSEILVRKKSNSFESQIKALQ